jgi:hypothetical protein
MRFEVAFVGGGTFWDVAGCGDTGGVRVLRERWFKSLSLSRVPGCARTGREHQQLLH